MKGRILFTAATAALAGWVYCIYLPLPGDLRTRHPERTAVMEQRLAEAEEKHVAFTIEYQWIPLKLISPHLQRAAIIGEDRRFYKHHGIDWRAYREECRYKGNKKFSWNNPGDLLAATKAVQYCAKNLDRLRGRSTITQQVAKNLYFSLKRDVIRKVREAVVVKRLEKALTKDEILEIYLNVAEFGPGIFGAEAAARHYYNCSAKDLTKEQAAELAATLPHPLTGNPEFHPERLTKKRMILNALK
jgi:monofunctional biosynthetic peptidoglycan transglycosylase